MEPTVHVPYKTFHELLEYAAWALNEQDPKTYLVEGPCSSGFPGGANHTLRRWINQHTHMHVKEM